VADLWRLRQDDQTLSLAGVDVALDRYRVARSELWVPPDEAVCEVQAIVREVLESRAVQVDAEDRVVQTVEDAGLYDDQFAIGATELKRLCALAGDGDLPSWKVHVYLFE
jgi:hypothetical protein